MADCFGNFFPKKPERIKIEPKERPITNEGVLEALMKPIRPPLAIMAPKKPDKKL